jgi:hypothetical protein
MPSILGSAELKFSKRDVGFTTLRFDEVSVKVRENLISRRVYLAVVPNGGTFQDYAWTGTVEFRLKGGTVETWRVGFKDLGGINPTLDFYGRTNGDILVVPPYVVETYTATTAPWPVAMGAANEQTVILDDTNTAATKYHVRMMPIEITGHFDEVVFRVQQAGTLLSGEKNAFLVVGCLSQPMPD